MVRYLYTTVSETDTLIILNPVAGSVPDRDNLLKILRDRLAAAGRSFVVHETREGEDLAALVRTACEQGIDLVIAAGGDGTIGDVVNGLIGTDVPLGIIPVGTGNLLARAAGVPLRSEEAMDLILGEHRKVGIDTMFAAGRHFVLNISTGISSRSIHDTSVKEKRRFGLLAYVWRVVGHILGFKSYRFDLVLDGYARTVDATELLVSNGPIMTDLPNLLGPAETFSDGRIDVYVINGRSAWDYLVIILRTIFRRPPRDELLIHFPVTRSLSIMAHRRSQPVQGDGEDFSTTPIEITVVPAAVRVIAP